MDCKGPRKRGNIVAEKLLLLMFPRRANKWEVKQMFCFLAAQTKKQTWKHLLRTQNVSEKIKKLFLRLGRKFCVRNKCCVRAQTGKHLRPQQCFRNNVSSFAGALTPSVKKLFNLWALSNQSKDMLVLFAGLRPSQIPSD